MEKEGRRPQAAKPPCATKYSGAAGAHPRVASLGLRPIHLQPVYKITGALPDLGRGGPWASRQDSDRERWLKKLRRSCRTAPGPNFCKPRAQWPGKNRTQALLILRAGNFLPPFRRVSLVMGVRPGKGECGHEVPTLSRPRGRFGSFAAMGKGTRRPQAAKPPCATKYSGAAGAHPRVASLGLQPIHLQPPPYGIARNEFNPGNEAPFSTGRNSAKRRAESSRPTEKESKPCPLIRPRGKP